MANNQGFSGIVQNNRSVDSGYATPQGGMRSDAAYGFNIPVMVSGETRYPSATYPGLRGSGTGSVGTPTDQIRMGHQVFDDVAMRQSPVHVVPLIHQSSPALSKSYHSSVMAQVGSTPELGHHRDSGFVYAPMSNSSENVTVIPVVASQSHSLAPSWSKPDSANVPVQTISVPAPVPSQLVYTTRIMPSGNSSGQSAMVGKPGIASSRRTAFVATGPGDSSSAATVSRQIPIQVLSSQSQPPRQENANMWQPSKPFQDIKVQQESVKSFQEPRLYQLKPTIDVGAVYSGGQVHSSSAGNTLQRSSSVDSNKEAEVDALTDLLVQNMSVAGNPDFYGMCAKCGRSIMGETAGCTALDQLFHIDCFRCETCNNLLRGQPFYAMDGRPFCELCYVATLEKCSVCSKPIMDRMLRATGKPYHPGCFNCVVCGKNLDGTTFTVDATNQIHCIDDFHRKFAPRCCVCGSPIMPNAGEEEAIRIVVLDRSFHVSCFRCEDCGLVLSSEAEGRGCYPCDDHILCKACNARRVHSMTRKSTTDL